MDTCPICGEKLRVIHTYGTPYCHFVCDYCEWMSGNFNRHDESYDG